MEKLICAANYWDDGIEHVHQPLNIKTGIVACGWRHHNCVQIMKLMGKPINAPYIRGFLTSKGRFVDRQEGQYIAATYGIVPHTGGTTLTSEDLY